DTDAVGRVLGVAHRLGVPVVPVGGLTGLAGGAVPRRGGIALSLERLDRIHPVDRDNLRVSAGAGTRTVDLQQAAVGAGLFDSVEAAGEAAAAIVRSGLVPSALELLDATCLALLREQLEGVPLAEGAALLLVEVDGPDDGRVGAELEHVSALLAGARERELAKREEDVELLWAARRALSPVIARSTRDFVFQDVCVPIAAVPEALRRIGDIAERYALRIPVFSHAGDGNLHPSIL